MSKQSPTSRVLRRVIPVLAAGLGSLVCAAAASAHATVSPAVSVTSKLQLYSLAVPTEKSHLTTRKIVMTVPRGFGIDSFVPPPAGWHQRVRQTGKGDSAVVTKVTWVGGHTPTGEDSLFQFLAQADSSKSYTFGVQQTYSDGSIVNWTGPESSDAPAPTIDVKDSLGGGGVSVLTLVALIVGLLGLAAGGFSLLRGGAGKRRPLA